MSRSGYTEDYDSEWQLICWRGAVASAIRGKRGQAFFKEMLAALDALPEKRLIRGELEVDGKVCALGAVGRIRGMDMSAIDPDDYHGVAVAFGIPRALAQEIMHENDDPAYWVEDSAEKRYERVRCWVKEQIRE